TALAIVPFADVDAALSRLTAILATGPAAVELLDDMVISLARANIEYRTYVDLLPQLPGASSRDPGAVRYVEYFGDDRAALERRLAALEECVAPGLVQRYFEKSEMKQAWALRRAGEPLLHAIPGLRKPVTFIEDTAVDPRRLGAFVREF